MPFQTFGLEVSNAMQTFGLKVMSFQTFGLEVKSF